MTPDEFKELQGYFTNDYVAKRLGVSLSSVTKWRGGQHPIPQPVAIAMRAIFGGAV